MTTHRPRAENRYSDYRSFEPFKDEARNNKALPTSLKGALRAARSGRAGRGKGGTSEQDHEYAPLTVGEIRRLLAGLTHPETTRHQRHRHLLHWSTWRRHHQATARRCHYQRYHRSGQEIQLEC